MQCLHNCVIIFLGVLLIKEYCIEVMHGRGEPYLVQSYKSVRDAKIALDNMLVIYSNRRKTFYVDNDFFNNKFENLISGDYFCIKEREVTEWVKYSEQSTIKNNLKNNIIYFKNYIDI